MTFFEGYLTLDLDSADIFRGIGIFLLIFALKDFFSNRPLKKVWADRPTAVRFRVKGTPSQEEHKTIFTSLKINKMALYNQIDFLAFFSLRKMTYQISSILEYDNPLSPLPCKMALRHHVKKIDFAELTGLRKLHVGVTESIADC